MHLVRLGIEQAKQVLLVADGAEWIWKYIPLLLQRSGCPPKAVHQLLDFYHATQHLQQFAPQLLPNNQNGLRRVKQAMSYPQAWGNC